jgi:glycosyltransferase involved in cell wall biosynthesis
LAQPALLREFHRSFSEITAGASHLVACADFVRERLVSNGVAPNRISVLRQALPGSTRTRVLRSLPTSGRLKLGFFGRLTKDKGPDLLVAGARTLRSEGYDATVELAGPLARADEPWLTPWLEANRTFARHVGVLGGDRLLEWIATRDLIVIPSRCLETGPLALLEAWDANTPAIGTASGGIAEFMGSQGLSDHLFAVDDVAGLAATVRRLSRDARSVTVTVPGIDELVRSTQAIYERACSTSPPTSEPASG